MARFFKPIIHYEDNHQIFSVANSVRTPAPEVNDNDYNTYSTATDYIIQTHGATATTNTTIDFIRIIGSGISTYTLQPVSGMGTGGGVTDRSIPTEVLLRPEGTMQSTTIDGLQYEFLDLRATPIVIVNAQSLTGSTATIANNLSSVAPSVTATISLSGATLSNPSTAGTVEIVGENPAGTTVMQTLSFASGSLEVDQDTTQQYVEITAVNLTGFSGGTLTITADNGVLFCTEAQLTFAGSPRIYEIQLLEHVLYLDPEQFFLNVSYGYRRNSILKRNILGNSFRVDRLGSRGKLRVSHSTHLRRWSPVSYNQFMSFAKNYENFTYEDQYERYPDQIFPATWGGDFDIGYFNRMLQNGQVVNLSIQES